MANIQECANNQHDWTVVYQDTFDNMLDGRQSVKWCSECGCVATYTDVDGRETNLVIKAPVAASQLLEMLTL